MGVLYEKCCVVMRKVGLTRFAVFWVSTEPYLVEVYLSIASLWAAYVLFTPPSNFATFPVAFRFIETIQGQESVWATLALVGAVLKIIGLTMKIMMKRRPWTVTSYFLRSIGLGISGFFWILMGVSSILGNPDTLFGIWGPLVGIAAWRILVKFLLTPGEV